MGDTYPVVRLAAAQAAPVFLNREATVAKACQLIIEAGKNGAKIIGFPECYIPAFPHWFEFYRRDHAKVRHFYKELFKNSVVIPSPATDDLCAAAKEAGITVVMGVNEKGAGTMGTMYNTQLFISSEGKILGKHRKIVPTLTERLVHGQGDGSTLNVFPTEFGEVGGLICGENTNSLARYALIAKGEKVHVASWPAFPTKPKHLENIDTRVRYHAYEAKNFVISATSIFSEEMKDIIGIDPKDRDSFVGDGGHSGIVGPEGDYIAGPVTGECIVYADADFEQMIEGKMTHDTIGHYNRFDIFKFTLNEEELTPLRKEK
ncbi:MAG: carbon-nitrogen hydrolase family protein [Deltaproteobacteria bacterium]|nr:carbon-nitrogen hydrolase family protein [Deltaproteobacteria bacterium]